MLVLTRKPGEKVVIELGELLRGLGVDRAAAAALGVDLGASCQIVATQIRPGAVKLGFAGWPQRLGIYREEIER